MRILALSLAAPLIFAGTALAHPEKSDPKPAKDISEIELPTQQEIDEILADLPDFNAIMGDFIALAKDDEVQARFEAAGEKMSRKLEKSRAFETDENGLPDFNAMMGVMMSMMAKDGPMEDLLETAQDIQAVMEKHVDEDGSLKPKSD